MFYRIGCACRTDQIKKVVLKVRIKGKFCEYSDLSPLFACVFPGTLPKRADTNILSRSQVPDSFSQASVRFSGETFDIADFEKQLKQLDGRALVKFLRGANLNVVVKAFLRAHKRLPLIDKDFRGTNLSELHLECADLAGSWVNHYTNLRGANLSGADLRDVDGLDIVHYDEDTNFEGVILSVDSRFCPVGYKASKSKYKGKNVKILNKQ